MIRIGVIGYGYWGPNIVRNFNGVNGAKVTAVCDLSEDMCQRVAKAYPGMEVTSDPNRILTSPDIDAVAVITPVFTHFDLAKKALENGKHVFVEKPFTSTVAQAEELNEIAAVNRMRDAASGRSSRWLRRACWATSTISTRPASIWVFSSTT